MSLKIKILFSFLLICAIFMVSVLGTNMTSRDIMRNANTLALQTFPAVERTKELIDSLKRTRGHFLLALDEEDDEALKAAQNSSATFIEELEALKTITGDTELSEISLSFRNYITDSTLITQDMIRGNEIQGIEDKIFSLSRAANVLDLKLIQYEQKKEVEFSNNMARIISTSRHLRTFVITVFAVSIVLAILLSIFLSHKISYPVFLLKSAAEKIKNGSLDERAKKVSDDEIGQLAEMFNSMTQELQNTLVQTQNQSQQLQVKTVELEENMKKLFDARQEWIDTFNHITDLIFITDINGYILRTNTTFDQADETIKVVLKNLFGNNSFEEHNDRSTTSGKYYTESTTIEEIEVQGRVLMLAISPARNSFGVLVSWVTAARDITDYKNVQKQLLQSQKMESIGVLAGGVAHDFNNLLGGILGYASLIEDRQEAAPLIQEHVKKIKNTALRASSLTKQLLSFSRQGKSENKVFNLRQAIDDVVAILTCTINKNIELVLDIDEDLYNTKGDVTQIEQVLLNLCLNAADAMPGGGTLRINATNKILNDDFVKKHLGAGLGEYIYLEISDTGIGMNKQTLEHIFEPFYTTKPVGKGTGLGCAITLGVVQSHKGYINVYSEVGSGSVFKIYLPRTLELLDAEEALESGSRYESHGETVLIVDDEEIMRDLAAEVLTKAGYQTRKAFDAQDAIEQLRDNLDNIDLVLLDMIMPKLNGREAFHRLKAIKPQLKVIVSSGYSRDGEVQKTLDEGAEQFVQKPYQIEELLSVIGQLLVKT